MTEDLSQQGPDAELPAEDLFPSTRFAVLSVVGGLIAVVLLGGLMSAAGVGSARDSLPTQAVDGTVAVPDAWYLMAVNDASGTGDSPCSWTGPLLAASKKSPTAMQAVTAPVTVSGLGPTSCGQSGQKLSTAYVRAVDGRLTLDHVYPAGG